MDKFHALHPDVALQVNVTRHPYSFVGDRKPQPQRQGELDGISTQPESLRTFGEQMAMATAAPTEEERRERMKPFLALGRAAGIDFDLEVKAQYQPIESQRLLLWAGRYGVAEEFMSALNRRHFERRESASLRSTLLAATEEVGLDVQAATAFLDSPELEEEVWRSYGATINQANIRAIPLFAFCVPSIGAMGGPFRPAGAFESYVVRGSSDTQTFLALFELILRDSVRGSREYDAASFPFRRDEWWAAARRK